MEPIKSIRAFGVGGCCKVWRSSERQPEDKNHKLRS